MSYVLGLTGGIGSGKSVVASMLAQRGAEVVDTDAIAHELTAPGGAAMASILASFGGQVVAPNGALDRVAMRKLAFSDSAARSRLEAILHPMIRAECERRCRASKAPYVVLVVPLLIESGTYRERCDRVLVVDCAEATQVERVAARSALAESEVRAIIAAQVPRGERLKAADDVIDNDGDIALLRAQVDRLHGLYASLARASVRRQPTIGR